MIKNKNDEERSLEAREHDKEEFKKQVRQISKQLRSMESWTVQPYGRFILHWDRLTIVALVFVAFITPFEVGLLSSSTEGSMLALFVLNRCVDVVFLADIVIQFFVPFRSREGLWVMDNRKMAWRYLTSTRPGRSFALDLISSIPYDSIVKLSAGDGVEGEQGGSLRALKMLRILKLVRMMRASRIFKRWEAQLGVSHATVKIIEFVIISLVMAHWMACLWCFVGRMGNYQTVLEDDPEWEARYPGLPYVYPGPKGPGHAYRHFSWIQKAGMYDAEPLELYGSALYLALANMFGGGGEPGPANYYEFYVQGIMMLVGSSVWAYIIGAGCGIIATLDPQGVEFRSESLPPQAFIACKYCRLMRLPHC